MEEPKISFRGRRQNEQVILVVKQHVWLLLPIFLAWIGLAVASMLVIHFFFASAPSAIMVSVALLLGVGYSIYHWYIWNNGVYIVTNQRVVKVDQRGLFSRLISEAEIDRIQEISSDIAGPIKTMLNFGTVKIQTASTTGQVDLRNVPHPYDIQQEIVRIQRAQMERAATGQVKSRTLS